MEFLNLYRSDQSWLEDPNVKKAAWELGISPAMLAVKWAEAKNATAVVPFVCRVDGREANNNRRRVLEGSSFASIHRTYVRDYHQAPPAEHCATALESALPQRSKTLPDVQVELLKITHQFQTEGTCDKKERDSKLGSGDALKAGGDNTPSQVPTPSKQALPTRRHNFQTMPEIGRASCRERV